MLAALTYGADEFGIVAPSMLERQREGIAKAKREGRYKGRVPTARRQAAEIIRPKQTGLTPSE